MPPDLLSGLTMLQAAGLVGAATYVASFVALTARVIDAESRAYFALNLAAAALVALSLAEAFNVASLVIQTFWIGVSLWGLATRLRRREPAAARLRPLP